MLRSSFDSGFLDVVRALGVQQTKQTTAYVFAFGAYAPKAKDV
jgi:hypothetical protein